MEPLSEADLAKIQDLIHEHRSGTGWELPDLVQQPPPLQKWLDRFTDWLSSLLPRPKANTNYNLEKIFEIGLLVAKWALYIAIAYALIWLIRQVVLAIRTRSNSFEAAAPEMAEALSENGLEAQLARAEAAQEWGLAARIVWKLFLRRFDEAKERTPRELISRYPALAPQLSVSYRLMFSPQPPADGQPAFQAWRDLLQQMERPVPHRE